MTRPSAWIGALRWLPVLLVAATLVAATLGGCGQSENAPAPAGDDRSPGRGADPDPTVAVPGPASGTWFEDVAAATGVDFVHFNGMTGDFHYAEVMGSGVAVFDMDRDGDLDLFFPQGRLIGRRHTMADALFPLQGRPGHRLYRNDLDPMSGPGSLRFTDVSEGSGIDDDGYGMGVAVGDVDRDGLPDLYVTVWAGPNRLYRNLGGGRFEDVTESAGVGDSRWSVAAVLFDPDADGDLDLYVGNYLEVTPELNRACTNDLGMRDYCGPVTFDPEPDVFYRNESEDGTIRFVDVTRDAQLLHSPAPVLGAVSGDFDGDGRLDLYLANDEYPNNLLVSRLESGNLTFRDEARLAGAAMNAQGMAEAGMGIAVGDPDNDLDEDLFVTHLLDETNTFYRNEGQGLFADRTLESGLAASSLPYTGFGTGFVDFDNDGMLDLLTVNGSVQGLKHKIAADDPYPLAQSDLFFVAEAPGRFRQVEGEPVIDREGVSRGAAFGDLDNDGDVDAVMSDNAGPARVLRNLRGQNAAWIGLRLVGPTGSDLLGSRVELLAPGPPQMRRVRTEGSYASASDPRVTFGLGAAQAASSAHIRITWPDGTSEERRDLPLRRYTEIRQNEASPEDGP